MLVFKFVLFIAYTMLIFFLPNLWQYMLLILFTNLLAIGISQVKFHKIWQNMLHFVPFIILAIAFNIMFDSLEYAIYIAIKLMLVCMVSSTYAQNMSFYKLSQVLQTLFIPLRILHVNTEEIVLVIYLALTTMVIFKRRIMEINLAIRAKNAKLNLMLLRQITLKLLTDFFRELDNIDAALRAKGIN